MKLFFLLLLQMLVFLPLTGLAADAGTGPVTRNLNKSEATEAQKAGLIKSYGQLPLYFIENDGQVDGQVRFYERGAGHETFFTSEGVVLSLTKRDDKSEKPSFKKDILGLKTEESSKTTTEALSLSFVGANKEPKISADEKQTGHVNYFVGNDKAKWRSNIPTYGAVTYKDVYKNIDVKFYGNNKNIEHDVIVRPGGDPSLVRFAYEGIKGLQVTEAGDLEVRLNHGKIIEKAPVIYQEIKGERVAVDGAYRLIKGEKGAFTYGVNVASYDKTKDLVIDPVLVYSTYLGGLSFDSATGIALDSAGAAYVTGQTFSTDFPLMNAIQAVKAGGWEAFITKLNPAGTALVYSTYLGGLNFENPESIAVDSAGSAYVTGQTFSTDFPLMNAIQAANAGHGDVFITKLNPAGTALVYSTYLGGLGDDRGFGIAVDSAGAAYVGGWTFSTDFPLAAPIQATFGGGFEDAFVTKLNPAGTALVYSTYLGGLGDDLTRGIAVDSAGAAYLTGWTFSTDFPLMNPIQATLTGGADAFITKIDPVGTALVYSTYLGGLNFENSFGIAVDGAGAAYVSGSTDSTDFPLVSPIQATFGGGLGDAFVTKINPVGSFLVYSTYFGGLNSDHTTGIAVDSAGAAYVTGTTGSADFPLKSPIQATLGGGLDDAFITKISGGTPPPAVVTLAVTPDALSIARGGTLGYNVTATNTTTTQQCFSYWENVTLPNGATFPTAGALFGPVNLCLNANASKTAHLTHGVPMNAPVGAYAFNAFVGTYPTPVTSENHFNFDVTALGPLTNQPATSWRVIENGFRK